MKILFSSISSPAFNLAAEEFLLFGKEEDFLFLYVNEPSVIVGSNQAVVNEVDMDFCIDNGIRIFRRLSGGGAVYHDLGNLNYAFIGSKTDAPLSADFLKPVVRALALLGIPAEIGKRKDLWLHGFKISGTASHLSRQRELHHGTLLYDADISVLQRALLPERRNLVTRATASVPSPVRNIRCFLEEKTGSAPDRKEFFDAFVREISSCCGVSLLSVFSEEEILRIDALRKSRYARREWNYRM